MLLIPVKAEFFISPFANVQGVAGLVWMTAALAGVLLLHRVEKVKVPRHMHLLMALAWALSLMFPLGFVDEKFRAPACCAWLCIMGLLLLVAGASVSRLRNQGESNLSWVECLLRGPAVALAAPLLLFASRPVARGGSSSPMQTLSRVAFAVFPYALAAGFTLTLFGSGWSPGLVLLSFSLWAWLGCALLFLLSPWPEYPRILMSDGLTKARKVGSLVSIALVAMALVQLALLGQYWVFVVFFHPWFMWGGVGCVLLLLLTPWPEYPRIPKLGDLPKARKVGPLRTAVFMAMALVPLASLALGPLRHVVSGDLFRSEFHRIHVGTVLDQPTIGKWFFLSALFAALAFPYAATARWMSDRSTRLGYWAFAVPTAALCLCLLSILTMPFWWLLQYIDAMGFTEVRISGVVYGLLGYVVILGFLCWAVWPPNKKRKPDGTGKHVRPCGS